jgi:CheY-like chemotaxis protein
VEDNEQVRHLAQRILEQRGYQVLAAALLRKLREVLDR